MVISNGVWPDSVPAVQVRFARPTDKLDELLDFYCTDLGLSQLYRSRAHGYEVVMVGLPGDTYSARRMSYSTRRNASGVRSFNVG
jgi:hypothetical protein